MKLTSLKLKSLPIGKSVCDGAGLYIRLTTKKSGNWSFKYMRGHKSREMGLGTFPEISIVDARQKTEDNRRLVINKIDPIEDKRRQEKTKEENQNDVEGSSDQEICEKLSLEKLTEEPMCPQACQEHETQAKESKKQDP